MNHSKSVVPRSTISTQQLRRLWTIDALRGLGESLRDVGSTVAALTEEDQAQVVSVLPVGALCALASTLDDDRLLDLIRSWRRVRS